MLDEINNGQTETTASEWSGTPFQGRNEPEEKPTEAAGEEQVQETSEPAAEPTPQQSNQGASQQIDYSRTFLELSEGDVVNGVVVHIDREGVLVDVGTKSEGIVRPNELSRQSGVNPEDIVQVGDKIDVYVMQSENQEGGLVLSKKRADFERAWEKVEEMHQNGKFLSAMVTDRVKGGLVVDLGIRGFVPASHVGSGKIKNLDKYVGQSIPLKVIEVDRERRKVVLSNRLAVEDEREKQRAETLSSIAEGQIRDGIVRRITDYGAFVDLGGIDGLLHISEMSWTRIKHPSDAVKQGDKIQVMILKLNLEQGKVSLGLRQILPDPWAEVQHKYHVGEIIKGSISRLVPFGAFVQVEGGIEGIIPNSELAIRRVNKPEDVVSVGQEIEVKVIDMRPEERRMTLSLRQLLPQPERAAREPREPREGNYQSYGREEQRTTIGDLVGDMIREARVGRRERKRKERQAVEEYEETHEDVEVPMFNEPAAAVEAAPAEAEATAEVEDVAPVVEEPAAEVVEPTAEPVEEPVAEQEAAPAEAEATPDVEDDAPAVEEPVAEVVEPTAEPVEEPVIEQEAAPVEAEPEVQEDAAPEAEAEAEAPAEEKAEE